MENSFNWSNGPLAEGLHCYRTERFFEAHEHWEAVWLSLHEPEKSFLQSLIQISAAFHHLRRGNRRGTVSLLTRALRRLDACPLSYCDLQIEPLREEVRRWISALLKEEQVNPPTSFPEFRILDR